MEIYLKKLALLQLVETEKIFSWEVTKNLQTKNKMIMNEILAGSSFSRQKLDMNWINSRSSENWRGDR